MTSVYTSPISFSLYPDYISTQESATPYRLYIVMLTASSILLSGCTATAAVQHKLYIPLCITAYLIFYAHAYETPSGLARAAARKRAIAGVVFTI